MNAAPDVVSTVDFAVIGNDSDALAWLGELLAATPGVRLLAGAEEHVAGEGEGLTGVIAEGLDAGGRTACASRLAVVLADPVRMLAEGDPGPLAPGGYAAAVGAALAEASGPVLVIAADELNGSETQVGVLLAHLGLDPRPAEVASLALVQAPLSPGRRALLFSSVRDDVEELERLAGRTFRCWRFSAPEQPGARLRPTGELFYFGRRRAIEVPSGAVGLDDWSVLPVALAPLLDGADHLTVLDPLSFPFDAMRDSDRDIPIAVALPDELDAQTLFALFGVPLLDELTPLDRISTGDGAWPGLRVWHSWADSIRVSEAELICARPRAASTTATRTEKATYRILRRALRRQLAAARDAVPAGEHESAIVLAETVEHWCPLLRIADVDLVGIDRDPDHVRRAAESFPEWRFQTELPDRADVETAHVSLIVNALCGCERDERRERVEALLRALRVGGRLILLDRFLEGREGHLTGAPTPRELLADVLEASSRHLVLEHVEAVRLRGDDLSSVGVFAFSKLGRPERL